jgi:hypothetical protein
MSAKVWCRLGNGTEHEELHPTEEAANQSLTRTLETHRKKGHRVSEKVLEQEQRLQYIATDGGGHLVAMYQIVD